MDIYDHERMRQFFAPKNIAIVGASSRNAWFGNMLNNSERLGSGCCFYPVNPKAEEISGVKAYKSIADLPESVIDFGVVMVKASLAFDAVQQLAKRGIKNLFLISSGYAETGEKGTLQQSELQKYCNENDIKLIGPNCLGFMNVADRYSIFCGGAVEGKFLPGAIGIVGQSGATSEIIATRLLQKMLGISLYITTGNEAVITAEDCIEYLIHDETTRVITGFIEEFRNVTKLKEVTLQAAQKGIPLILIKIGRSDKGSQAARSHTGALSGNDAVLDGFFRQYGIIRVDTIEELIETAGIFTHCSLPAGDGLGIYTLSGGLGGLYADLCSDLGIRLPSFSRQTISRLMAVLPDFAAPDNPLDLTGAGFRSGTEKIFEILGSDENINIIAPLCIPPQGAFDSDLARAINEIFISRMDGIGKTIVPIPFTEMNDHAREYFHKSGVYPIEQPELGFRAIAHLIRYSQFLRKTGNIKEKRENH